MNEMDSLLLRDNNGFHVNFKRHTLMPVLVTHNVYILDMPIAH